VFKEDGAVRLDLLGITPHALTAISTSRGLGSGTATRLMASGSPGLWRRAASMSAGDIHFQH
jgi:hypothetical protein